MDTKRSFILKDEWWLNIDIATTNLPINIIFINIEFMNKYEDIYKKNKLARTRDENLLYNIVDKFKKRNAVRSPDMKINTSTKINKSPIK